MKLQREVLPVYRAAIGVRVIAATLVALSMLAAQDCGRRVRSRLDEQVRMYPLPAKQPLHGRHR